MIFLSARASPSRGLSCARAGPLTSAMINPTASKAPASHRLPGSGRERLLGRLRRAWRAATIFMRTPALFDRPRLARLFVRAPVADVVDAFERRNDLFVVRDHDDGGLILTRHTVENANHRQGALA